MEAERDPLTRRRLLQRSAAASALVLLGGCGGGDDRPEPGRGPGRGGAAEAPPTPACDDGDEPTPQQAEGPFFRPDTPRRTRLVEAGMAGTPLTLTGRVVDTSCRPIPGALLDFWHADDRGEYDDDGYRLRGHQFADGRGRFRLETIVPGAYSGRTRHIHVKVQRRGGEVLTTQLYFPGEPQNRADGLFDDALLMEVRPAGERRRARFDFVLA